MCAKLRTVAASNDRDHARNLSSRMLAIMFDCSHVSIGRVSTSQSLFLLLARATYIMVLFFTHTPFVVNHTINTTPPEKVQQSHWIFPAGLHSSFSLNVTPSSQHFLLLLVVCEGAEGSMNLRFNDSKQQQYLWQ